MLPAEFTPALHPGGEATRSDGLDGRHLQAVVTSTVLLVVGVQRAETGIERDGERRELARLRRAAGILHDVVMDSFPAGALGKAGRDAIVDHVRVDRTCGERNSFLDLRANQMLAEGRKHIGGAARDENAWRIKLEEPYSVAEDIGPGARASAEDDGIVDPRLGSCQANAELDWRC